VTPLEAAVTAPTAAPARPEPRVELKYESIPEMFLARVRETPHREALRFPDANDQWRSLTWEQTLERVHLVCPWPGRGVQRHHTIQGRISRPRRRVLEPLPRVEYRRFHPEMLPAASERIVQRRSGERCHRSRQVVRLSNCVRVAARECVDTKFGKRGILQEKVAAVKEATLEQHGRWMKPHMPYYAAIAEAFENPIVVGDSAAPVYSANGFFNATRPRSYFTSSTGFGTLGYGLPAAIGAKVAMPERPVASVIGDGGLLFTVAELVSAVEAKAGIPILLWNNRRYLTIKDYMIQDQIRPIGVIEHSPEFQAIAKGCGCEGAVLKSEKGLVEALRAADARDRPTVIEIDVPEEA